MERGKYLARRHEGTKGKPESVFLCVCRRIQTLTQCNIFISFMSFMVRMAVLCDFVTLCEKRSRNDGMVLHRVCPRCPEWGSPRLRELKLEREKARKVEGREQWKHVYLTAFSG